MSLNPLSTGNVLRRNLAANIIRLAEERNLARAHLADQAGIGRTTLWQILDVGGRYPDRDPRLSTAEALAEVLGVEPWALLVQPPEPVAAVSGPSAAGGVS